MACEVLSWLHLGEHLNTHGYSEAVAVCVGWLQPTRTFKLTREMAAMRTKRPALAAVQLNSPRPTPTKTPTKVAAARRESADAASVAAANAAAMAAAAVACGMARAAVEAAAAAEVAATLPVAANEELIEVSRLGLPTVPGYDLIEKLGCGGFGSVFLARASSGGCEVALKVVSHGGRVSHEAGSEALAEFDPEEAEHEASVHRRLAAAIPRHPRVANPSPNPDPARTRTRTRTRLAAATPRHPAVVEMHDLISEISRAVLVLERVDGCDPARSVLV